jgi:hypothetical protein
MGMYSSTSRSFRALPGQKFLNSLGADGETVAFSWTVMACALIVLQLGCGGSPQAGSTTVNLVINSASPIPTVNGQAFTMDVYGSGFVSGVTVLLEGSSLPSPFVATTFIDSTHLTATIPANAYPAPTGGYNVYLANPPNCTNQYCDLGLWSNAFNFQVQPGS